jgi:adenine deaminase
VSSDEGYEKLSKGMALIIREGSVAKNLKTLVPLVTEFNSMQCLLCTDDRNPFEIHHEGHINFLLKEMMNKHHVPPHIAYRLSSFSAAKHFGLKRLGLIAPGKQADIVLISDLKAVTIENVFINGIEVKKLDLPNKINEKLQKSDAPLKNTIKRNPVSVSEFNYQLSKGTYNVIEIIENEIITNHLKINYDGNKFSADDVLFMANIERYGNNLPPGLALVKGMGLKNGAIAASVAHDSHNLMIIGDNLEDMVLAANTLIKSGGGLTVTSHQKVEALLELPLAGLISLKSAEELVQELDHLKNAFKKINIKLHEPFIQMAFLALPVIPSLKLTDRGLFDVTKFQYIPLKDS